MSVSFETETPGESYDCPVESILVALRWSLANEALSMDLVERVRFGHVSSRLDETCELPRLTDDGDVLESRWTDRREQEENEEGRLRTRRGAVNLGVK